MLNSGSRLLITAVAGLVSSLSFAQIVISDDLGRYWSDLNLKTCEAGCDEHPPSLDLQTLKNAKLACLAQGGRLPELSEVDGLASWISREFLLKPETHDQVSFEARFMREPRGFWTATVKQESDRYVFNRAIARLSTLHNLVDMSKAESVYVPATQDNKKRPFLCVFGLPSEPEGSPAQTPEQK